MVRTELGTWIAGGKSRRVPTAGRQGSTLLHMLAAVLLTLPVFILLTAAPRGAMEEASTSYEEAKASVAKVRHALRDNTPRV